jgi:hypothetical protein
VCWQEDDAMDDLHRHPSTVLMDRQWDHGLAAAVDLTLLNRFYERFADHAVDVARRVIFQTTGKHLPATSTCPRPADGSTESAPAGTMHTTGCSVEPQSCLSVCYAAIVPAGEVRRRRPPGLPYW